jgi:hypothetical protein
MSILFFLISSQMERLFASSLYSKLLTSPLDTGLEQEYTCSMKLLNKPGKVYLIHPARPIKKARTSLAWFLSQTDHERVARSAATV